MFGWDQDPPVKINFTYKRCMECKDPGPEDCAKCGKCGRWFDEGRCGNKDEYPGV